MVAIKDMKMPTCCASCPFDVLSKCLLTRQFIKGGRLVNGEDKRLDDCPLVEIGTCKDCRNATESQYNKCIYCSLIEHNCNEDFYCKEYKKRGSENETN